MGGAIHFYPTTRSKTFSDSDYDKFFELSDSNNGIQIESTAQYSVIPFDADISIEGNSLVLAGYISSNNSNSSCVVKIKIPAKGLRFYDFSINVSDQKNAAQVKELLTRYNWAIV